MSGTVVKKKAIWRDLKGRLTNTIALIYAVSGHLLGRRLMVQSSALLVTSGLLMTAHTMVIGAYLVHECGRMTLFRSKKINARMAAHRWDKKMTRTDPISRVEYETLHKDPLILFFPVDAHEQYGPRLRAVFGGTCHVVS